MSNNSSNSTDSFNVNVSDELVMLHHYMLHVTLNTLERIWIMQSQWHWFSFIYTCGHSNISCAVINCSADVHSLPVHTEVHGSCCHVEPLSTTVHKHSNQPQTQLFHSQSVEYNLNLTVGARRYCVMWNRLTDRRPGNIMPLILEMSFYFYTLSEFSTIMNQSQNTHL